MRRSRFDPTPALLTFGVIAFCLASLSVADMFVPRPSDGVIPRTDTGERVVVGEVLPGSGAEVAGLVPGDQIIGIGREVLLGARHAARILKQFQPGETIVYLIKRPSGLDEIPVQVGLRRIADGSYLYSCLMGFSFFFVGLFVLVRRPRLRASQIFFLLSNFFLLFLVCQMRPPSYSGIDSLLLRIGTVAFLMLPAAFLHFFVLFPRPAWLEAAEDHPRWRHLAQLWRWGWPLLYVLPPVVFFASLTVARMRRLEEHLIRGAPPASWALLVAFLFLGLLALRANAKRLQSPRERRGLALVFFGSALGLGPYLAATLVLTGHQHSRTFFLFGVLPLVLVPLTFTYAIVRFQLLDIRVILRRSLLYTVTTVMVSGLYAAGIVMFDTFFRGTRLDRPGTFAVVLALAIVLLFDPLRRRVQALIDRAFFAERSRLERAMVDLGDAVAAEHDPTAVVQQLVERLPKILGLHFAALYLLRSYRLERVAGPEDLPESFAVLPELQRTLARRNRLVRVDQLGALALRSPAVAERLETLAGLGVEAIGDLASRRRHLGMVLLSAKEGQIALEREELDLLRQLLQQAALALETGLLLDERTQRAELEREMEIAATIQSQLLPGDLHLGDGWQIAAACRPARIVGGDFVTQLPASCDGHDDCQAVIFGDVCGKSVSGALMMMAAHEALHSLALTSTDPERLFRLANRRFYSFGRRNFVALGYFAPASRERLAYLVAGQPAPLIRRADGSVSELTLPDYRIPVGAMREGPYQMLEAVLEPGDLVVGYSDGVIEAQSHGGEFFGDERLAEVLANGPEDPQELVDTVLAAVMEFSRGDVQYDDMTLVAVCRRP